MARKISASEGLWFGAMLLGQITAILAITALIGWGADHVFKVSPIGLAAGVVLGSVWATATTLLSVRRKLVE